MKLKSDYWKHIESPNFSIDHYFVEEEGDAEKVKSCFGGFAEDWMTDLSTLYDTLIAMRSSKKFSQKTLFRMVMEDLEKKLPLLAKVVNLDVERKLRSLRRFKSKASNELRIYDPSIYLEDEN